MSLEQAKPSIEPILKNKKKAELIKAKMTGTTLEAVAQKSGASILPATGVTLQNAVIPNVGQEPKVVGKAFGLGAGKTSKLIEGEMGVYMIRAKAVVKAPALPNYTSYVTRLKSQSQGSASGRAIGALKGAAKIEDNRVEFQ
jgi:peptidyl-prolyl cis-trans isomerase D